MQLYTVTDKEEQTVCAVYMFQQFFCLLFGINIVTEYRHCSLPSQVKYIKYTFIQLQIIYNKNSQPKIEYPIDYLTLVFHFLFLNDFFYLMCIDVFCIYVCGRVRIPWSWSCRQLQLPYGCQELNLGLGRVARALNCQAILQPSGIQF